MTAVAPAPSRGPKPMVDERKGRVEQTILYVLVVVPFLALVDGLWQLNDKPYRQTLHDKAAGTIVIKVAP